MENQMKSVPELHAEINQWKELVQLVNDETKIFEHQLEIIVSAQPSKEVLAHLQRFESMFIRQKEVSDELFHDLKMADHDLKVIIDQDPEAMQKQVPDHSRLRDMVMMYEKLFLELRSEFRMFHLMAAHA
jgi:hypothetical protein